MTTNTKLEFFEAYKIYSQRWSLEVIFKEAKGMLGLGKCQANNFASQIASTSLVALQYNILSVVKRFTAYETMGKLFQDITKDSLELSVTDRIWGAGPYMRYLQIKTGKLNLRNMNYYNSLSSSIFVQDESLYRRLPKPYWIYLTH